jgi:hypothetical protein
MKIDSMACPFLVSLGHAFHSLEVSGESIAQEQCRIAYITLLDGVIDIADYAESFGFHQEGLGRALPPGRALQPTVK